MMYENALLPLPVLLLLQSVTDEN